MWGYRGQATNTDQTTANISTTKLAHMLGRMPDKINPFYQIRILLFKLPCITSFRPIFKLILSPQDIFPCAYFCSLVQTNLKDYNLKAYQK